jgi:hypothetical protein
VDYLNQKTVGMLPIITGKGMMDRQCIPARIKMKERSIMINILNEEITKVAYELYVKSNRQEGNDLLNWLAAERIVQFQKMLVPDFEGEAIFLLEYKPVYGDKSARTTSGKTKPRSRKALKKAIPGKARRVHESGSEEITRGAVRGKRANT